MRDTECKHQWFSLPPHAPLSSHKGKAIRLKCCLCKITVRATIWCIEVDWNEAEKEIEKTHDYTTLKTEEFLSKKPWEVLSLNFSIQQKFRAAEINTMKELLTRSRSSLLKRRGIGYKTVKIIQSELGRFDLALAKENNNE